MQNPLIEHAAQAGLVASAATGKVDGYQASVQVSGLAKGASVRFAVQVACIPAAPSPVYGPPGYPQVTSSLTGSGTVMPG